MGNALDPGVTALRMVVVNIDAGLELTPTATEFLLLGVPDLGNIQYEVRYVGYSAVTLPVDAGVAVEFDLEWVDDSAADAVANLKADYDLQTGPTVRVMNTVWEGSQILDPGDTLNAEMDVATPTTASEGAALVVVYKVLGASGY